MRRRKQIAAIVGLALPGLVIAVAVFIVAPWAGNESGPPRAAIVDQLSLTAPNPDFVRDAAGTLNEAGYAVDYFPGEYVTVDFYRDLPKRGYEVVVFRAHAGAVTTVNTSGEVVSSSGSSLSTSEPYSKWRHTDEQRVDLLSVATFSYNRAPADLANEYFAIMPEFVTASMKGDFDGAAVILMGCEVLTDTELAEAFVTKGAEAVVGWDDTVSASHTDAATLNMLEHFVLEGVSLQEAAQLASEQVGPDPYYGSTLVSYPRDP